MSARDRRLVVAGGPNGAGKTTFAEQHIVEQDWQYLSADRIATELCPADPTSVQILAGRRFIQQVKSELQHGSGNLIVESTLSGRTFRRALQEANYAGVHVTIIFLYLDSTDECVERVSERVRKGGHSVPPDDIRRRYLRSIDNFWHIYRSLADHWALIYNSDSEPVDVARGDGDSYSVVDTIRFSQFLQLVEQAG